VERALAIVTEGRMPQVVGEAGGVHDIRVQAERRRELAPHLRDLERVREAVASEIGSLRRTQHLRLGGEPTKRTRVEQPGAVAGEVAAAGVVLLGEEACDVVLAVALGSKARL